MAKDKKRGNREIKKPKQVKALPAPENPLANQVRPTASAPRRKGGS